MQALQVYSHEDVDSMDAQTKRTMTEAASCCSSLHCCLAASAKALSFTAKLRSPWQTSSGSRSITTLVRPGSSAGCCAAAGGVLRMGPAFSEARAGKDWMLRRALGGGGGGGGAALPFELPAQIRS